MVFLIPENDLKIQQYNRVVIDLNGYSWTNFLEVLKSQFDLKLQKNGKATKRKHSFKMYLKGQFYCVSLQKSFTFKNAPLYHLDTYILQELILKPILGVTNVRNNKRDAGIYQGFDSCL